MPKPPRPSASEVLRHDLLILVGLPSHIVLSEGAGEMYLQYGWRPYTGRPGDVWSVYSMRHSEGGQ